MSYTTAAAKTNLDSTRQVVAVALAAYCLVIQNEDPATVGHAARKAFATDVIRDPLKWAPIFAIGIVAQNQAVVTDAEIDTAIAAVWNAYAGV